MLIALARKIRNFSRNSDGSITVEFVATLPLILGALAFSFEFGRAIWAHHIVTKGVRDATRFMTRAPLSAEFVTQAENLAKTGQVSGGVAGFPWSDAATVSIDTNLRTFSDTDFRVSGSIIQVRADVPLTLTTLGFLGIDTSLDMTIIDEARHYGN